MKTYLLRGVDDNLWLKIQTLVRERGMTIKGLILTLLKKECDLFDREKD